MGFLEQKKALDARMAELVDDRQDWDSHWQDLVDHMMPRHGRNLNQSSSSTERNSGSKKSDFIIDGNPEYNVGILAAGLQAGLTSPARPWFQLKVQDPALNKNLAVRAWLEEIEERMRLVFGRSNLYSVLHHVYAELGTFGTAAMSQLADFNTVTRFQPYTIGEYYLATSATMQVDTFYRSFWMTARQIVQQYEGKRVPQSVHNLVDRSSTEKGFQVHQVIEPNDDRMDTKDPQGRHWRSIHWMAESTAETDFLQTGFFRQFPVFAPRWDVPGTDVYGSSPGMNVLADVKMLQKMQKKTLIALDKVIDPPLRAPGSLKNEIINTMPGGVTFDNSAATPQGFAPLYEIRPDFGSMENKIQGVRADIGKRMFNDLFLMLANMAPKTMTATEVAIRNEEKMLMLGPVLERLEGELLDPLIERTFDLMVDVGLIPEAPQELQGQELKVEYISILAQAQKLVAVAGIENTVRFGGSLAAIKPEVVDVFDFDEMVYMYGDIQGAPATLFNDKKEVEAIRAQRAKQEQEAAAMEQATQLAQGARTLSEAELNGTSVLDQIL